MQNPQMPRERIKRPELPPQFEPEPETVEDSEGLTQDELNEWLTQKIIRLELGQFRKEAMTPSQQRQPQPQRPAEKVKPKIQPYEAMYGPTEDDLVKTGKVVKPKGKSKAKMIMMFIAIIIIAYILFQVGLMLFAGYSIPGQ